MSDHIDPRLQYANPLPQPSSQPYPSAPGLQNAAAQHHQPYYHLPPTSSASQAHLQHPQLGVAQPAPPSIDPALESPAPHGSPEDDDDDHDVDDGAHETPGSAKSPNSFKRPRACDSCRGLKVRCDQERLDQPCKRCAKANRPCITTPPTRKRVKKADSRVAELERKIDALTATLHAQKGGAPEMLPHGGLPQYPSTTGAVPQPEGSFRYPSIPQDWQGRYPEPPPGYGPAQSIQRGPEPSAKRRKMGDSDSHATIPEDMDAIHRDLAEHPEMKRAHKTGIQADHSYINALVDSLVSPELAERIFYRYVNEICPHFPAVPLPPGITPSEVREKRPLLFLAILAGSSHGSAERLVPQDVQRELTRVLKDTFADIIWRNGEKSLEIVQALHLGVLWYRPPIVYEQHNFYMMVNCAAVMALDLGLGRRPTPNVMKLHSSNQRYQPNSSSIDARRTFLVCYYLCMSITMVLRRPILLRWTKFMDESLNILQTSPEALPSDKILCQHIKMARIGENISVQFCMDDPNAEVAISDPKVVYALKVFENELQQLREEDAAMGNSDPALRLAEHVTNLYIHEIALHHNQSAADFQPPFPNLNLVSGGVGQKESVGPVHIGALGECLTATHGILDTILAVPFDTLVTLPVIFCVRAIYAIVCLMKMWVAVNSSGEVGTIIKAEELQIEAYMDRLVSMFNAIVTRDEQSPHGKFFHVAKRLQDRFAAIKESASRVESETKDEDQHASNTKAPSNSRSGQSSTNQNPGGLHLLSEVAMGSSGTAQAHPQQQQQVMHSQPPQQPPMTWYDNAAMGGPPQADMGAMPQGGFDPNFDFTQFDLMGSDADLSALFIPDGMIWNYGPPMPPGYNTGGYQ